MTSEALYINDVLVDLERAQGIALTKQFNNIAELQDRQGDFSNAFNLPKTPTNRTVLENADNLNSGTLIPYRANTARYVVNGVEVVREGTARLLKTTDRYYVVQVTSGNVSFFEAIPADLKVSDVIGDSLDHVNNFANVTASRSNTSGYIYPLIDWQNDSDDLYTTSAIDVPKLLPCIFVKDIFEGVDSLTGWQSYGALLDLPDFENLLLTPDLLQRGSAAQALYNSKATGTTSGSTYPTAITFQVNGTNFGSDAYNAAEPLYGYMTLKASADITNPTGAPLAGFLRYRVYVNGGPTVFFQMLVGFSLNPGQTLQFYGSDVSANALFTSGDTYTVEVDTLGGGASAVSFVSNHEWEFKLVNELPYGSLMPVGELFENVPVRQLLQDVMNLYASMPAANSFQQRVRFGLFNEVAENTVNAPDWSGKFHRTSNEMGFTYGKYGQRNWLRYAPTETVTPEYGDYYFDIDNETLPDSVDVVKISTSAVEDVVRYQGQLYPKIKACNAVREFTRTNNRFLILNRQDTAYTHEYDDGTDTLETGTDIPYATFRPLLFSALTPAYYGTLTGMLFKTKAPAYVFKLSQQDFNNFDPFTPIRLDVHTDEADATGYFYVSAINGYNNGFAGVSLVRL